VPEKDIQSCLERSQLETLLAEFTDVTFKACVLVQRNWRSVRAWRAARAKRAGLQFLEEQHANEDAARGPSAEALIQRNVFARLSDKELDFYRDVFERIDEDHSGRIDRAELQLAFQAPHRTPPRRTAPHCAVLHCTAPHRAVPHCTAPHRAAPRRTAPRRTVLHLIAPPSHPGPPSRTATPAAPRAQGQRLTGRLGPDPICDAFLALDGAGAGAGGERGRARCADGAARREDRRGRFHRRAPT